MDAINTATSGLISAANRFDRAAGQSVRDSTQGKDILSDFIEQIEARQAFAANISVVKTADEMLGRALDIRA